MTFDKPLTPEQRDEWFRPMNDRIWGPGNWVKCARCVDTYGNPSYHHRAHHDGPLAELDAT